jgi:hypothetical protein
MQKWEYFVLVRSQLNGQWRWAEDNKDNRSSNEVLNDLGKQGWELVSTPTMLASLYGNVGSTVMQYIFKRPL